MTDFIFWICKWFYNAGVKNTYDHSGGIAFWKKAEFNKMFHLESSVIILEYNSWTSLDI